MRPATALWRGARHAGAAGLEAVLLAIIISALLIALSPMYHPATNLSGASDAFAAGRTTGHIYVSDAPFGSQMTATLNPGGPTAWAYAECTQNGYVVYQQYVKGDANNQAVFTLGPTPSWSSGAASCTAQEGYWAKGSRWKVLAEATFNVY